MCRFYARFGATNIWDDDYGEGNGSSGGEDLPKVLIAITAIKQRADCALEDIINMAEICRKTRYILQNILIIHRNIKENSAIATKRLSRLSEHMETYRRIVRQLHRELDISAQLQIFSVDIQALMERVDTFHDLWLKTDKRLTESVDMFDDNYRQIVGYKGRATRAMTDRDHLKVCELCLECRRDYRLCKDNDQTCNEWCKESGDECQEICDQINRLETKFNDILKRSLDSMSKHTTTPQTSPLDTHKDMTGRQEVDDCDH
jgi:hypothetical protein